MADFTGQQYTIASASGSISFITANSWATPRGRQPLGIPTYTVRALDLSVPGSPRYETWDTKNLAFRTKTCPVAGTYTDFCVLSQSFPIEGTASYIDPTTYPLPFHAESSGFNISTGEWTSTGTLGFLSTIAPPFGSPYWTNTTVKSIPCLEVNATSSLQGVNTLPVESTFDIYNDKFLITFGYYFTSALTNATIYADTSTNINFYITPAGGLQANLYLYNTKTTLYETFVYNVPNFFKLNEWHVYSFLWLNGVFQARVDSLVRFSTTLPNLSLNQYLPATYDAYAFRNPFTGDYPSGYLKSLTLAGNSWPSMSIKLVRDLESYHGSLINRLI